VAAVLHNTAIGYHHGNGELNIALGHQTRQPSPRDLINTVTRTTRTQ